MDWSTGVRFPEEVMFLALLYPSWPWDTLSPAKLVAGLLPQ